MGFGFTAVFFPQLLLPAHAAERVLDISLVCCVHRVVVARGHMHREQNGWDSRHMSFWISCSEIGPSP